MEESTAEQQKMVVQEDDEASNNSEGSCHGSNSKILNLNSESNLVCDSDDKNIIKEENVNSQLDETDSNLVEPYKNITIQTIEIPEDDDLFDFQKDVSETEPNLRSTELYRYLTDDTPNLLKEDDNPTLLIEGEITPCRSRRDSGDSDQSGASDGYVTLSSDDEEETPDKQSRSSCIEEDITPQKSVSPPPVVRKKPGRKPNPNKICKKPVSRSEGLSARTLDKLEKSRLVTDKWIKDLEIPENLSFSQSVTLDLLELNQYLTCGLCNGYLYEASTVTECMHTFCKNCIVRHCMEMSLHCPVCNILIHPTDPFVNIRLDRMIQDIVYKLLPNVAETEMERIEQFYSEHPEVEPKEVYQPPCQTQISPREKEDQTKSPCVSLLLETEDGQVKQESLEKKFIRVTSRATIHHVCSFLKQKLNLTDQSEIDLYCCGDAVEDRASTLENIKNKFFGDQDSLMLLQYKIRES